MQNVSQVIASQSRISQLMQHCQYIVHTNLNFLQLNIVTTWLMEIKTLSVIKVKISMELSTAFYSVA